MGQVHRVIARFSDGAELEFSADEDQPVLTAALAADINLLHQCRAGSCSTCICQRVQGDFQMETTTSIALLPAEVKQGKLLTCLAHAKSDGVIEFGYESDWLDRERARKYTATVLDVVRACDSVTELQLELDPDGDDLRFASGMFFLLNVPGTDQWRAFSASTTPEQIPQMNFLIRHVPDGVMTDYVASLCERGDTIEIEGPFGEFFLREADAPLIMVAGGTGLAPILSMLDSIRERRRNRNKILLCFGVTRFEDLFYLDELELRRHWMPQLEVRVAVAIADPLWEGPVGMVTDLLQEGDGSERHLAYVCGPPPMVEAALERLVATGVSRDAIHYERFAASSSAAVEDPALS